MKGTDCTPEQIAHAKEFVVGRGWNGDAEKAIITTDDLVRVVAWYGALRFKAARDREGGTLEHPGELVVGAALPSPQEHP